MNDLELERAARHAAAWMRSEAERAADPDAALAQLLAGETSSGGAGPPDRRRGRWVGLASAAAIVALIVGIVVVSRHRSDSSTVESPPTGSLPPVASEPAASSTIAPTTAVSSVPPVAGSGPVIVAGAIGAPLERRVLATYTEGDGVGQLGFEDCQGCQPYRPWAPIVTDDGTVIVADSFNRRWQVYRGGAWTAVPYGPGEVVVGSPVIAPNGLIYALVAEDLRGSPHTVASFEPAGPTLVESLGPAPADSTAVDIVNGTVRVGAVDITDLATPLGTATWDRDEQSNIITVALSGISRSFQLPEQWNTDPGGIAALADGSVVVRITAPPSDPASDVDSLLLRLWPDGTYTSGEVATLPRTTNLDVQFTDSGMVQLEDDVIVEYGFPTEPPATGDPVDTTVETPSPTTTAAPSGMIGIGVDYFGMRYLDEEPYFAIDRFGPDGEIRETLDAATAEQFRTPRTLADGSSVRLDGEFGQGRCANQQLVVVNGTATAPLSSELSAARSFGISPHGVVVATRDVCPSGTRWGDDGTRHELVMVDPASPGADVQVLMTREADPDLIVYDDGTDRIAMGELHVRDISPDGRYVTVSDSLNPDDTRWHLIDTARPGAPVDLASSCEHNGDIVGPPRFLGDGVVVVARVCSPDDLPESPQQGIGEGETQVDAIDLDAGASGTVLWHATTPGLHPDSYSRTAAVSATTGDDGAIWVIVTGNGGTEDPPDSYLLHGSQFIDITRPGWYSFAFDPTHLV